MKTVYDIFLDITVTALLLCPAQGTLADPAHAPIVLRIKRANHNNLNRYMKMGYRAIHYCCTKICRANIGEDFITAHAITEIRKLVMESATLARIAERCFSANDLLAMAPSTFLLAYVGYQWLQDKEVCDCFVRDLFKPLGNALSAKFETLHQRILSGSLPTINLEEVAEEDEDGVAIALLKRHSRH
ncbi:hypothetical protein B0H16DRAFT_1740082 [Mycena metata]|uniref:Uncharacterized protein n=1 Tax=Mycena metata TaxID=1033252 RepID=A0AAD7HEJ0_9AGAR|nr:hypothetical protein B0H16DRAFT_1740082 [Mycena metata]